MSGKKATRVRIAQEELDKMTKEDLLKCWLLQDQYVDFVESKLQSNKEHAELLSLRESEEKLRQQQLESNRREHILVMRLTTKEHDLQEFAGQIQELKQGPVGTVSQLRSALLDPAVNLLFERMKSETDSLKAHLEETQNELNAWKFTPDSNTGKRLMAKCRLLYQENEELGKIIASGRMAKLEGDLALQKSFSDEMKKSQSELDEFLLELDEDVEGMQSTIYYLQQQLRETKEQLAQLQVEKERPQSDHPLTNHTPSPTALQVAKSPPHPASPETKETDHRNTNPTHNSTPNCYVKIKLKVEPPLPPPAEDQSTDCEENDAPELDSAARKPEPDSITQSVIVVNKRSFHQEAMTNSLEPVEVCKQPTDHHKPIAETKSEPSDLTAKPNRRTSERGQKRTRPRTPVQESAPIKEENLPLRKRARRKDFNPEPLEIDTDTEVQVAQTLASWASTKKERTSEAISDVGKSNVGNGDVKTGD